MNCYELQVYSPATSTTHTAVIHMNADNLEQVVAFAQHYYDEQHSAGAFKKIVRSCKLVEDIQCK